MATALCRLLSCFFGMALGFRVWGVRCFGGSLYQRAYYSLFGPLGRLGRLGLRSQGFCEWRLMCSRVCGVRGLRLWTSLKSLMWNLRRGFLLKLCNGLVFSAGASRANLEILVGFVQGGKCFHPFLSRSLLRRILELWRLSPKSPNPKPQDPALRHLGCQVHVARRPLLQFSPRSF